MRMEYTQIKSMVKLIRSGSRLEFFHYDVPFSLNRNSNVARSKRLIFDIDYQTRRYNTLKNELSRVIECNPHLDKFLTLTFKDNLTDFSVCNAIFKSFIRRLRKCCPQFDYIAIVEFQARGAIHYHVLLDIPFMSVYKLNYLWRYGGITIKKTTTKRYLAFYLSKYLSKNLFDGRLYRKKKYFCSEGIKHPQVLYNDEALSFFQYCKGNLKLVDESSYTTAFIGVVKYWRYEIINSNSFFNGCPVVHVNDCEIMPSLRGIQADGLPSP